MYIMSILFGSLGNYSDAFTERSDLYDRALVSKYLFGNALSFYSELTLYKRHGKEKEVHSRTSDFPAMTLSVLATLIRKKPTVAV